METVGGGGEGEGAGSGGGVDRRGVTMTRDVNRADGVGFPYPAWTEPAGDEDEGEGKSRNITW